MSSPTLKVAGHLRRLRRRLAAVLGRRPRRADGGIVAIAGDSEKHDDADHLGDLPDGAGCTEIWEHLSDRRDEENGDGCD